MTRSTFALSRSRAALAAALLALGMAGAAQAAGAPGSTYVGGALSAPDYRDPIGGSGDGSGGTGPGLKVYGGYQVTPNFAVEGGVFHLGRTHDVNGTGRAYGAYVDGVGSVEVAPQWSLLGSVGLAQAKLTSAQGSDYSPAVKLGVGVQYDITSQAAVRVGYDRYHFTSAYGGNADVGQTSVGVKFSY